MTKKYLHLVEYHMALACALGYIDCDIGGNNLSAVPIEIDQCEESAKQLKAEYGDDYLTNREKMHLTSDKIHLISDKIHLMN